LNWARHAKIYGINSFNVLDFQFGVAISGSNRTEACEMKSAGGGSAKVKNKSMWSRIGKAPKQGYERPFLPDRAA
jgi:hypothetical protein